ncbi:MAG: FliM/FliN family flagellar motor switch protein [Acidobacteriota bacterium]
MTTPTRHKRHPAHTVLDPRLLGRPVHMLQAFTSRLKADLSEVFIGSLNRRYRATFQIGDVSLSPADQQGHTLDDDVRWLTLAAAVGRIGFQIDRPVLMTVLHYRYGLQDSRAADDTRGNHAPATATEERLATTLGLQLVNILALRIETPESGFEHEISPPHDFTPVPLAVPQSGSWTLSVVVRELTHEVEGVIRFRLDAAWMERLLRNLAPHRDKGGNPGATANMAPLGAQLPLTIVARLLEMDMPLGNLMDLRVGDVIPVRLGAADVLIDEARLFEATVAEHQGKLCLTSFEDLE